MFLGEDFSFINGIGLVVLICGVGVFNLNKYRKHVSSLETGAVRTPRASLGELHRRTSSDALELLEHGAKSHQEANGPMGNRPAGAIAMSAIRESSLKVQSTSISGPASHRRDVPVPNV